MPIGGPVIAVPDVSIPILEPDTVTTTGSSPHTRNISVPGTYTVTSVTDGNTPHCSNTGTGSAVVTLLAPSLSATTQDANTRTVRLVWTSVTGATGYRMERSTCLSCGWSPIAPNPITALTNDDTVSASTLPVAYLYRIIALGNGTESPPSPIDFATTATLLFAETIGTNGTPVVRGSDVQELRRAIDALRRSAGRPAFWSDYSAPTGFVLASHVLDMRGALDEAWFYLINAHIAFTGDTPAGGHLIYADQLNQLRAGVK